MTHTRVLSYVIIHINSKLLSFATIHDFQEYIMFYTRIFRSRVEHIPLNNKRKKVYPKSPFLKILELYSFYLTPNYQGVFKLGYPSRFETSFEYRNCLQVYPYNG